MSNILETDLHILLATISGVIIILTLMLIGLSVAKVAKMHAETLLIRETEKDIRIRRGGLSDK